MKEEFWPFNNIKNVRIHFNGGISKRVIDWIERDYPTIDVHWRVFEDYSYIEVTNMKEDKVDDFINKLYDRYPIEIETLR